MSLAFPPLYLLPVNLGSGEIERLEESIPSLTWDINEAKVVVGRITRRERALFELRRLKVRTEETKKDQESNSAPASTDIKVVRLAWLTESLKQKVVIPIYPYVLYQGRKVNDAEERTVLGSANPAQGERAVNRLDRPKSGLSVGGSDLDMESRMSTGLHQPHVQAHLTTSPRSTRTDRPTLQHETTSEHDAPLPEVPQFLHTRYSCQRPTPVNSPNNAFVGQLKKIRTHRLLEGDQIGVRAYSTTIAAIAAYPYELQSSFEVSRLPGCGSKIAELFHQWKEHGELSEVTQVATDPRLSVLQLFYDIWGVGDTTARDFYSKGWRDLDDLVEYGWISLSRVQQIGVKYYDDFQLRISRPEVEAIGATVLSHARQVDSDFRMVIAGGYRRGKRESGDVDVVLSHPNETMTERFIEKIVSRLENSQYITHTLSLSTRNSERGQIPLPWKGEGGRGSGFDTLDKALVVWQNPNMQGTPRRRVDLIISPWKTVGCALLGWSGGTTFQRDIRRYCKAEKHLKFDSSGVRDRRDGTWVDLERATSAEPALEMEEAERRVFQALELPWRTPEERCTG